MNIDPSLNSWTTIFLVVALHGFVLSAIFFFRKKGRKAPNILLGGFLFLFSVMLLEYVAFWTNYNIMFPHIVGVSLSFQFLYGPLIFLYVLSVLKPDKKWRWEYLHFLPFLLHLMWIAPSYLYTSAEKAAMLIQNAETTLSLNNTMRFFVIIKSVHMLIYTGLLFNLERISGPLGINMNRISEQKSVWTRVIKYGFFGYVSTYILFHVMVDTIGYNLEYDYLISFATSVFIFTIGYVGLSKPDTLYEAHNGFKYENSSLGESKSDHYLEKLLLYMEDETPYVDGDLKMEDLAEALDIPRHHLSQIINERLGKNFFEFINSYRVDEAKRILSDPERADDIILRVALESGFNNKTTFNSAFKSQVGTTPSKYRKKTLNGRLTHH
ncbi:MAG: helix-turn-helix domain-containing protein [Bacteroidetes bacterium]|nr:helix-turn-helix domain-containing protein [Bacteroidota bacterium]